MAIRAQMLWGPMGPIVDDGENSFAQHIRLALLFTEIGEKLASCLTALT